MILLIAAAAAMNPCERAGTQADSTECAWKQFRQADQVLNTQYRNAIAEAVRRDSHGWKDRRPSDVEALRSAQRAWINFRDLHCRVEGYWGRGGTIESMLVNFCFTRLTRERTEQLRKMWHRR